jgi:hypothetical protein
MEATTIRANIDEYLSDRNPDARYASFDYCFNYFQGFREREEIQTLANSDNIQNSCLQLGFYLASWGMYRGSARLLQTSARHLVAIIKVIANTEQSVWELDAGSYSEQANIDLLLGSADNIRSACPDLNMSEKLLTKILLGVFGCVPAFDTYFMRGWGAEGNRATFNPATLRQIARFYRENAEVIDDRRPYTYNFLCGEQTRRKYSQAKMIDMIFFTEGDHLEAVE